MKTLLLTLLVLGNIALADTFILKDGTEIKGKQFASTKTEIFVKTIKGKLVTIKRDQLDKHVKDKNLPVKPKPQKQDDTKPTVKKPVMITCKVCEGTGLPVCYKCHGAGKGVIRCKHCKYNKKADQMQMKCTHCKGKGTIRLITGFSSSRYQVIACPTCKGKRRIACPYCKGASKGYCATCKGIGYCAGHTRLHTQIQCKVCNGTGKVEKKEAK